MFDAITRMFEGYDTFWPLNWLLIGAGLCISIELGAKKAESVRLAVFYAALFGVLAAFVSLFSYWGEGTTHSILVNSVLPDKLGIFMCGGVLIGTAICVFTSYDLAAKLRISLADYLALVLVGASGMVLLATSNDLIMMFLAIELMSLAIYVLVGFNLDSGRSTEAAMKYFIMGAFASGFLLLGMALIYGVTGEVETAKIAASLANPGSGLQQLALLGIGLMVIGFGFKVGAVPFHQWVPDAYTGAPTPVAGFMAVAVKTAAFAAFIRFGFTMLPSLSTVAPEAGKLAILPADILWFVAAITMVLGNWLALTQENVKRMLAYSSVAHSGYLLMGLTVAHDSPDAVSAMLFYLLVYAFGTGGAFAVLTYTSADRDNDDVRDLRGLGWKRPLPALVLAVCVLSLAGIPLTGGFLGKYFLFASAVEAGYVWLPLIGILASIVGAFYYLRVVYLLYMKEPADDSAPAGESWGVQFGLVTAAVLLMALGVWPNPALNPAREASAELNTALKGIHQFAPAAPQAVALAGK